MHPTDTVYDDSNVEQMASLAPTQMHRNVDLELLKADEEGYIKSYIILPSTIYGVANHKLTQLGIANNHSLQIPQLVGASLKRGQAGMVGEGKNVWPNVHVDDGEFIARPCREQPLMSPCCVKSPNFTSPFWTLSRVEIQTQHTARKAITLANQVNTRSTTSPNGSRK